MAYKAQMIKSFRRDGFWLRVFDPDITVLIPEDDYDRNSANVKAVFNSFGLTESDVNFLPGYDD